MIHYKIDKKVLLELQVLLGNSLNSLEGPFVSKRSGYEKDLCDLINDFTKQTSRYHDCIWTKQNLRIEIKKGLNFWFDLIRYSEIVVGKEKEAKVPTFTLFFIPNRSGKERIVEIIGVDTSKIIEEFKLSKSSGKQIISLNGNVPRQINVQANLTLKDIREIACFNVK